jgi:alpha-tubulin suppressor-like RCC1 family protein
VTSITNAIQITAGGSTTCALLADHTIKCWGSDAQAQISADGIPSSDYLTPIPVGGLTSVIDVITTGWATCVLLSNGTVRCWGSSTGSGGGAAAAIATMSPLSAATRLGGNVCAVLSDKTVKCWSGVADSPTARAGLPASITQIAGNCALSSDGGVRCWGPGAQGQIGNGLTDDQTTPQQVQLLGTATWIGSGNVHVCAILSDQSFACWGKDGFFSPIDYGPYPLPISGIGKIAAAAAGDDNTCVIETNNTVKCWGSNLSGYLLGTNGTTLSNSATPVVITGLPGGS